jgi:hypothetical protein
MHYVTQSNVTCSGQVNKYHAATEADLDGLRNHSVWPAGESLAEAEAEAERLNDKLREDWADCPNVAIG